MERREALLQQLAEQPLELVAEVLALEEHCAGKTKNCARRKKSWRKRKPSLPS
jgi:hypothetical protein